MKTTFYGVSAEFHDSGRALACITSIESEWEPDGEFHDLSDRTVFKIWFSSEQEAKSLAYLVCECKLGIYGALDLYEARKAGRAA